MQRAHPMGAVIRRAAIAALAFPATVVLAQQGEVGGLQVDRSKPVPAKSEIIAAWQKR